MVEYFARENKHPQRRRIQFKKKRKQNTDCDYRLFSFVEKAVWIHWLKKAFYFFSLFPLKQKKYRFEVRVILKVHCTVLNLQVQGFATFSSVV